MMPAPPAPLSTDTRRQTSAPDPQVVEFASGIPGFEACRRFVVVTSPELTPLSCLQSLDPPEASFLVVDPRVLDAGYNVSLREFERVRLGAAVDEPLLWLAIVAVVDNHATVNLRAPIVINPRRMLGCQFIRDEERYAVDFSLGKV